MTWPNNTHLINPRFLSTPQNLPINNLRQGAPFKPKWVTQNWRKKAPCTSLPESLAQNSDVEGNEQLSNDTAKEGSQVLVSPKVTDAANTGESEKSEDVYKIVLVDHLI